MNGKHRDDLEDELGLLRLFFKHDHCCEEQSHFMSLRPADCWELKKHFYDELDVLDRKLGWILGFSSAMFLANSIVLKFIVDITRLESFKLDYCNFIPSIVSLVVTALLALISSFAPTSWVSKYKEPDDDVRKIVDKYETDIKSHKRRRIVNLLQLMVTKENRERRLKLSMYLGGGCVLAFLVSTILLFNTVSTPVN